MKKTGKELRPGIKVLDAGAGTRPYEKYFTHTEYESTDFEQVFAAPQGEEEASEEEGEVETPAANIDPGKAVAAAMNLEIFPSDDLMKKYGDLGQAMAAAFKTNKDEV